MWKKQKELDKNFSLKCNLKQVNDLKNIKVKSFSIAFTDLILLNIKTNYSDEINEHKIIENEKKKELFEKMKSQMEADIKVNNLFV